MAAHRQDYQICVKDNYSKNPTRISLEKFGLRSSAEMAEVECMTIACRYCICCRHCPCELNMWSISYIAGFASIGIGLLVFIVSWQKRSSKLLGTMPKRDDSEVVEKMGPLRSLNNQDLAIVRKAVDLWHTSGMISDGLREELLSSATAVAKNNGSQHYLAGGLVILSFTIFLFESVTSNTLLYKLISPFMIFVSSPVIAKGVAMLFIAATSLLYGSNHPFWELIRGFCILTFLGCITLSVVDTGHHEGETSTETWGSQLWYMIVGGLGVVGFSILHEVDRERSSLYHVWLVASYGLLFNADSPGVLSASTLMILLIPKRTEQKEVDFVVISYFLVGVVLLRHDNNDDEGFSDYVNLVLVGASGLLMLLGIRRKSSLYSAASTLAFCLEASYQLATIEYSWFGLNLPLRLSLFFTVVCFGIKWLLRHASETGAINARMRDAMGSVLVGLTLVMLLLVVAIGNGHNYEEWALSMDFEDFHWTEGSYPYDQRLRLLLWALPILVYYRSLYALWPQLEQKYRKFHLLGIVSFEVFACHLLRSVSWSTLILLLAGLVWKLQWLEEMLRGGP